ncbi:hypothetical protein F5Y16DRAFT_105068 [Xylariaceae sp. FL0255]|nr:hypothetical protein F5Y16DRAFT_105068 [Xylariaceae sp. FL0255]
MNTTSNKQLFHTKRTAFHPIDLRAHIWHGPTRRGASSTPCTERSRRSPKAKSQAMVTLPSLSERRPRQVGVCLKHLSHDAGERYNSGNVPWQRVINAKGIISPRSQPSGARNQAAALQGEGVEVSTGALGELMVDFGEYGWFPRSLPSEENEDDDDSEDEEGEEQ